MKKHIPYSLLAAAAACAMAYGDTAYTTPVGYSTQSLIQGFNASGLTLQTPSLAAGALDSVSGTALTDDQLTFTPTAGRIYVLEIVAAANAAAVGTIQEIPAASISGTTITASDDISGLVAAGDRYILRVAPTLEDIFTTVPLATGGVLAAALSSGSADIVWVPKGNGTYDQYFLHSSTLAFRRAGTTTPTPNVPLIYADGLLVQKRTTAAASLTVSGEVKKVGTNSVAVQGFNLLGVVAPVGLNLFNSGLDATLAPALSVGSADVVWVQNPNLTYTQYFRRSGTLVESGWRVSGASVNLTVAQAEAVTLSPGFLVQRRASSSINIGLKVPTSHSSF
ncbi:MAG: hypothetical protein WED15_07275 [Akkermansiaceae bacterium]